MSIAAWMKKNTTSLAGKTVAISGATGGIGRELCRHLAGLGASLILLDRNEKKSRALGAALCAEFPLLAVDYIRVDMTEMDTVIAAADALEGKCEKMFISAVRAGVIIFTAAIAIGNLNIGDSIVQIAFTLILGAVCVAAAVAFGIGGREAAAKLLNSWSEKLRK